MILDGTLATHIDILNATCCAEALGQVLYIYLLQNYRIQMDIGISRRELGGSYLRCRMDVAMTLVGFNLYLFVLCSWIGRAWALHLSGTAPATPVIVCF